MSPKNVIRKTMKPNLNPKPLNPKLLNPKPYTPKPYTQNPKPYTPKPKSSVGAPRPPSDEELQVLFCPLGGGVLTTRV